MDGKSLSNTIKLRVPLEVVGKTKPVQTVMISLFNSKGMTLMSVLLIIFVLGLVATLGYLAPLPQVSQSQSQRTIDRMQVIKIAVTNYRKNFSSNPSTLDALVTPGTPACAVDSVSTSSFYQQRRGWCGPYIDRAVEQDPSSFKTDGWGTVFQYDAITVVSCGPNRTCGDADDISLTL
jgi:hypothetical protein